jgi:hypothetical protein
MPHVKNIINDYEKIQEELNELFLQFSESLGLQCKIEKLKVLSSILAEVHLKIELVNGENGKFETVNSSKYELNWEKKCKKHLVNPNCLRKKYKASLYGLPENEIYEVIGIYSERKQKYPVVIQNIKTKKIIKVSVSFLKSLETGNREVF